MLIERAEVIPYALPFREPYVTARGRLDRRELILFRLKTDEGVVGWGETTSMSLRGGRALQTIAEELEAAGRDLLSNSDDGFSVLLANLDETHRFSPEARCAYYTALRDADSRLAGEPFGWLGEGPIDCNATLAAGAPERVAEDAVRFSEQGFGTVKLKVGTRNDIDQVTAVREALPDDTRIRIDANGAWDIETAIATLRTLEPLRIELCEQPTSTLEEMAEVRRATSIPIAADESIANEADSHRAEDLGACDLATLKPVKAGWPATGGSGWSLPVYLSSALEGPVGISAAGYGARAVRARREDAGVAHGLATQLLFAETIAARGPEVRDGMLHLPEGPGLGVEIDEGALERHRI